MELSPQLREAIERFEALYVQPELQRRADALDRFLLRQYPGEVTRGDTVVVHPQPHGGGAPDGNLQREESSR